MIDVHDTYFLKDNPKNHQNSYVKDVYAPRKYQRLKKYNSRGFQITVINLGSNIGNREWMEWKSYWDEEGRKFYQ